MFKLFVIVLNLATGQVQPMMAEESYASFKACVDKIPEAMAPAEAAMSDPDKKAVIAFGCAKFASQGERGADAR